jgi:hypothetical protein
MAMMKTPPPRRNYAQMVRVIRDEQSGQFNASTPYQLGKAYASEASSGSDTRIRSLDEIGINTRPANQLQSPDNSGYYSSRESTTLYHQLSDDQQLYFNGVSPKAAPTRLDARPGTKTRTYLNSNTPSENINVSSQRTHSSTHSGKQQNTLNAEMNMSKGNTAKEYHSLLNTCSAPLETHIPNHSTAPKQTRLPFVERASLEGIEGTSLDFSLSF